MPASPTSSMYYARRMGSLCALITGLSLTMLAPTAVLAQAAQPTKPNAAPSPATKTPAASSKRSAPASTAKRSGNAAPRRQAVKRPPKDLIELVPARVGGLKADEVAVAAQQHAPSLDMKNAEIAAAAAKVDETLAQFFPQLTASGKYIHMSKVELNFGGDQEGFLVGVANGGPLGVAPCPGGVGTCVVDSTGTPAMGTQLDFSMPNPPRNTFSLEASLSIPISDYLWTYRPAKLAVIAEQEGYEVARKVEVRKVRGDARTAYYNWLRALAAVQVTKIGIDQLQARIKDAKIALAAGAISTLEIRRLEALEAKTQAGLEAAQGFLSLSAQQIALMMGSDKAPTHPDPSAWKTSVDPALRTGVQAQIDHAYEHRLEFASIGAGLKGLRQGQKGARSQYYPRLDGVGNFTYANPNQRFFPQVQEWNASWYAGVALTWMVHQIPKARAQIRGLKAKEQKLLAQKSMLRRGLELEVRKAYLDAQTAHRSAQALHRSTLASEEAYRVATQRFKAGESTASELIDAQAELTQARLQEINARIDIKVASLRLRMATGREL